VFFVAEVCDKQEGRNGDFPRTMKGGGSVRPGLLLFLSGADCRLITPPPPPPSPSLSSYSHNCDQFFFPKGVWDNVSLLKNLRAFLIIPLVLLSCATSPKNTNAPLWVSDKEAAYPEREWLGLPQKNESVYNKGRIKEL
jgi:hypothetical protein